MKAMASLRNYNGDKRKYRNKAVILLPKSHLS